jgi:hypothetical protein
MSKYAKAIVAVLGAGVAAALQLGLTGATQQALTVVAAMLTALMVFAWPNKAAE